MSILVPEHVLDRLRLMAAERGMSMADLIREALEDKIAGERPRPRSTGVGASGQTDTSERTGTERPAPRSWR
jgi:plasmid stability protein